MHPYQIEEAVSTRKILATVIISIIAAYGLSNLLRLIPNISFWWIDYPSVLGFYGIFSWLFNNHLWKLQFFQKILLLNIPNLNGLWETEGITSQNEFEKPIPGKMFIHQTASKISITLETNNSISKSLIAAIIRTDKLNKYELTYNYINNPKADSNLALQIHYGTASFRISPDVKSLDGDYYTGRGRQTYGRVKARYIGQSIN
jgi:hypothetical protein